MIITKKGMIHYFDKKFIDKLCMIAKVAKEDNVLFVSDYNPPSVAKHKINVIDTGDIVITKYHKTDIMDVSAFNEYGVKLKHSRFKPSKWKTTPYIVVIRRFCVSSNVNYIYIWNMSTAAVARSISDGYISVVNTLNAIAKSNIPLDNMMSLLKNVYSGVWTTKHYSEINNPTHLTDITSSNVVLKVGDNIVYAHNVPMLKELSTLVVSV